MRLTDFEELKPLVITNAKIVKKLGRIGKSKKGENKMLRMFL